MVCCVWLVVVACSLAYETVVAIGDVCCLLVFVVDWLLITAVWSLLHSCVVSCLFVAGAAASCC